MSTQDTVFWCFFYVSQQNVANLVQHWLLVICVTANNGFHHSLMIWVWIWLAWLGTFGLLNNFSFWLSSNFWTQFFHTIMFQGHLWKRTRWRIYFLAYDFYSFHPNNFRNTTSWECFVKNDGVRSCLIELQSLFRARLMSTQYTVFWCFIHALCMYCARRGALKSIVSGSLWFLSMGPTSRKNTVCLLLNVLTSRYQSWIHDGV